MSVTSSILRLTAYDILNKVLWKTLPTKKFKAKNKIAVIIISVRDRMSTY